MNLIENTENKAKIDGDSDRDHYLEPDKRSFKNVQVFVGNLN